MQESFTRRKFLTHGASAALATGVLSLTRVRISECAQAGDGPPAGSSDIQVKEFRRSGMLYRRLGLTDLFVSVLGFGAHTDPHYKIPLKWGNKLTEEGQLRRDRLISEALDRGVNMFDVYQPERQYEPMARMTKGRREKVLVSLKYQRGSGLDLAKAIEQSADLFGGYIDLYRLNRPERDERYLENWDILRKAKQAGKVRAIGIVSHTPAFMTLALGELEGLDFIVFPYNFIHAKADYSEFLPAAIKKGLGLIVIKPLAAGSIMKLDPRARPGSSPEYEGIEVVKPGKASILSGVVAELTKSLNRLPDETLCQAAMRFVYSRSFVSCTIPSMFQEQELDDNYKSLQRRLELGRSESEGLEGVRKVAFMLQGGWLKRGYKWLEDEWRA